LESRNVILTFLNAKLNVYKTHSVLFLQSLFVINYWDNVKNALVLWDAPQQAIFVNKEFVLKSAVRIRIAHKSRKPVYPKFVMNALKTVIVTMVMSAIQLINNVFNVFNKVIVELNSAILLAVFVLNAYQVQIAKLLKPVTLSRTNVVAPAATQYPAILHLNVHRLIQQVDFVYSAFKILIAMKNIDAKIINVYEFNVRI